MPRRNRIGIAEELNKPKENYLSLPDEVWARIIEEYLYKQDVARLSQTCRFFQRIGSDPLIRKSVAYAPRNYEKTPKIKLLNDGEPLHGGEISCMVGLPGGRLATSSNSDHYIKVWNLRTSACEYELNFPLVRCLAALHDGRVIAAYQTEFSVIDPVRRKHIKIPISRNKNNIWSVQVLADGGVAFGLGSVIALWDPAFPKGVKQFLAHPQPVYSLAQLADGRLVSGSWDGTIKIWCLNTYRCEVTLNAARGWIRGLVALPEDRLLSVHDRVINVWNLKTLDCEHSINLNFHVQKIIGLSENRGVLTDYLGVDLWSFTKDVPRFFNKKEILDTRLIESVAYLTDGQLAVGNADGQVYFCEFPRLDVVPTQRRCVIL